MQASGQNSSDAPQGANDSRFAIHDSPRDSAERQRLLARAKEIEQRLDAYRDWRARQLAKEAELLDALKAHRAFLAKGIDRAYRLSAELSGIRARLAGLGAAAPSPQIANRESRMVPRPATGRP